MGRSAAAGRPTFCPMRRRSRSSMSSILLMSGITAAALMLNASTQAHGALEFWLAVIGLSLLLGCVYAPAWTGRGGRSSGKLYVATITSYLLCLGLFLVAVKTNSFWTWPFGIAGCAMFVVANIFVALWRQSSRRRSPLLRPHHDVTETFKRPPGGRRAA
jgi:hypothetical protein